MLCERFNEKSGVVETPLLFTYDRIAVLAFPFLVAPNLIQHFCSNGE